MKQLRIRKHEAPKCACGEVANHFIAYLDPTTAPSGKDFNGKSRLEAQATAWACEKHVMTACQVLINGLDIREQEV